MAGKFVYLVTIRADNSRDMLLTVTRTNPLVTVEDVDDMTKHLLQDGVNRGILLFGQVTSITPLYAKYWWQFWR